MEQKHNPSYFKRSDPRLNARDISPTMSPNRGGLGFSDKDTKDYIVEETPRQNNANDTPKHKPKGLRGFRKFLPFGSGNKSTVQSSKKRTDQIETPLEDADIRKLISLYSTYENLYNPKNPQYGNKQIENIYFSDMARSFPNQTGPTIQACLEGLRLSFAREYAIIENARRRYGEILTPSIKYYNEFLFLVPFININFDDTNEALRYEQPIGHDGSAAGCGPSKIRTSASKAWNPMGLSYIKNKYIVNATPVSGMQFFGTKSKHKAQPETISLNTMYVKRSRKGEQPVPEQSVLEAQQQPPALEQRKPQQPPEQSGQQQSPQGLSQEHQSGQHHSQQRLSQEQQPGQHHSPQRLSQEQQPGKHHSPQRLSQEQQPGKHHSPQRLSQEQQHGQHHSPQRLSQEQQPGQKQTPQRLSQEQQQQRQSESRPVDAEQQKRVSTTESQRQSAQLEEDNKKRASQAGLEKKETCDCSGHEEVANSGSLECKGTCIQNPRYKCIAVIKAPGQADFSEDPRMSGVENNREGRNSGYSNGQSQGSRASQESRKSQDQRGLPPETSRDQQVAMLLDLIRAELDSAPDFIFFDAKWRIIEILREVNKRHMIHKKGDPSQCTCAPCECGNVPEAKKPGPSRPLPHLKSHGCPYCSDQRRR
ncbi:uncharacterized protein LOC135433814 isoform X2 [Drosophila montana]|uniref:uncharacterized protein LOC135433814 isoform X2 n=1 Tax=Drosophila montana TaxID=40370 RepID=UPI00313E82CD